MATNTVWRWEAGQVPISVPMGKLITVVTRTVVHPTGHEMRRGQR